MDLYKNTETILLTGVPGAGKGTLANALTSKNSNYFHYSSGEAIRQHYQEKGEMYNKYFKDLQPGEFIDDAQLEEMTTHWFSERPETQELREDPKNRIILIDGSPRTINQVPYFLEHFNVTHMVELYLNKEGSLIRQGRRPGRGNENFEKKYADDQRLTQPMRDYIRKENIIPYNIIPAEELTAATFTDRPLREIIAMFELVTKPL